MCRLSVHYFRSCKIWWTMGRNSLSLKARCYAKGNHTTRVWFHTVLHSQWQGDVLTSRTISCFNTKIKQLIHDILCKYCVYKLYTWINIKPDFILSLRLYLNTDFGPSQYNLKVIHSLFITYQRAGIKQYKYQVYIYDL